MINKNRKEKREKMKFEKLFILSILLLFVGLAAAEILSIQPSSQQVAQGEEFEINVSIDDVVDLYSYQFDLTYNPAILQYSPSPNVEGPFLSSDGGTTYHLGPTTTIPGLLDNFAVTRYGSYLTGVSGGGILAQFKFIGIAPGTSNFVLSNSLLYNSTSTGTSILHSTQGGSATVVDCDVDGDTYYSMFSPCGGTDCNDNDPDEQPGQTWYSDVDGDLFSNGTTLIQCERPTGYKISTDLIATVGDCNDEDSSIRPDATEVCDSVDNNCDNNIDEGFTAEECAYICEISGWDYNTTRFPPYVCCGNDGIEDGPFEQIESFCYDGRDNDCDSQPDIFDSDCSGECAGTGENDYWVIGTGDCNQCDFDGDNDGDQSGDWSAYPPGTADQCDSDCGVVTQNVNAVDYEGVVELTCDGIDNDCDGTIDDDNVKTIYYRDYDGDGAGNPDVTTEACDQPAGYVLLGDDCNDNDPNQKPGQTWYLDADGDLYSNGTTLIQCEKPVNYDIDTNLISTVGDCNDNDDSINPGATEVCDSVDNNCNSNIDEGFTAEECAYICGISGGSDFNLSRVSQGVNLVCCGNDANEDNPFEPIEISCSGGSDNDCDGEIDMFDSDCSGECANDAENNYWVSGTGTCNQCGYDGDNDGDQLIGNWDLYPGMADVCDSDCGTVSETVQFGDFEPLVELTCDGIDNDCDGTIDDDNVKTIYYRDYDGDGAGNPDVTTEACDQPAGYVLLGDDCNDNDPNQKPGQTWYLDADGDLYSNGVNQIRCDQPANYFLATDLLATEGDCNDNDDLINPDAIEVCDGVDNNCNGGLIDEGFDADECEYVCVAGIHNFDITRFALSPELVCCGDDANEDNPFQLPEANCSDGSDNDCNGKIDIFDSSCSGVCSNDAENDVWVDGQGDCNQCGYDGDNDGDQSGDWSAYPPGTADQCDSDCGIVVQTIQANEYEPVEISCYNNLDDDCDGRIDIEDLDCDAIIYDINQDGYVNVGDFVAIIPYFGNEGCTFGNTWCERRDVNRDTFVNVFDLQKIGQHFS